MVQPRLHRLIEPERDLQRQHQEPGVGNGTVYPVRQADKLQTEKKGGEEDQNASRLS